MLFRDSHPYCHALQDWDPSSASQHGHSPIAIEIPQTGQCYELTEEEVRLCQLMDGSRSPGEILELFEKSYQQTLSPKILRQLVKRLDALGMIGEGRGHHNSTQRTAQTQNPTAMNSPPGVVMANAPTAEEISVPPPTSQAPLPPGSHDIKTPPLKQGTTGRWHWFTPDRLFERLGHFLWPLRWGVWILFFSAPLALYGLYHHRMEMTFLLKVFSHTSESLAIVIHFTLGLILINLISKIAQGVTLVQCGGSSQSFGVRLALGIYPKFYLDTRGIRQLPRHHQWAVYVSPLVTRLALATLGLLLWQSAGYQSHNQLATLGLLIGLGGLGAFLFTLNPLIPADGYGLLTTYFNMPRLRDDAFHVIATLFEKRQFPERLHRRASWIALGYGLASILFIILIIFFMLTSIGHILIGRFQGSGALLWILIAIPMGMWLWGKIFSRLQHKNTKIRMRSQQRTAHLSPFTKEDPLPDHVETHKIHWPRAMLLGILGGLSLWPYTYETGGDVTLMATQQAEIHVETAGNILEIKTSEGQWVTAGTLLGKITAWGLEREIATTQAAIAQKEAELSLLLAPIKAETKMVGEKNLALAKEIEKNYQGQFDLLKPGLKSGAITQLDYEEAKAKASNAHMEADLAKAKLNELVSAPRSEEMTVKKAEIAVLKTQLLHNQNALKRSYLYAPIDGKIVAPHFAMKQGHYLKEGDLFAEILDDRLLLGDVYVPESDIIEVSPSQATVRFRPWADNGATYEGKIKAIAPVVEEHPSNPYLRIVRVSVSFANPEGRLKPNMTGYAKIPTETKPLIVAMTRMIVRFFLIEVWSWLP